MTIYSNGNTILNDNNFKYRAKQIKLLALDVDGVLTDGSITYSANESGNEQKTFNALDGLGIRLLQRVGIQVALITGRQSEVVVRRAKELDIALVLQGRNDKLVALKELCQQLSINLKQAAYMGDDLPDISAIQQSGVGFAPINAHTLAKSVALYCTIERGGNGAVREVCDILLQAKGEYDGIIQPYFN